MSGREVDFDVVVVGAGIAGTVCAYQLATRGWQVLLVERGPEPGSKNLSGGVFYCRVMEQVFPGFVDEAPVERRITRNVLSVLTGSAHVNLDSWDDRLAQPANAVSVLRAKLDPWLAARCEDAGVMTMSGVRVDELIFDGPQCVGIRAGQDEVRAHVVVAADGVNSFLARAAGVRQAPPAGHLAVGVKSVIAMPRSTIEDRFGVTGTDGAAYAVVGDATRAVAGGGFLYTNLDSVSVGVVLRLDDLVASGESAAQVHDHFLAHPAIAPFLRDGELLEYGSHLTIEAGPRLVDEELTRPGLLVIGDAAGLTLNTGLTVRGMDLAVLSALAAAETADGALQRGETGQPSMSGYPAALRRGLLKADLDTYAKAPAFLANPRLYRDYGPLLSEVLFDTYRLDLTPRRRLVGTARAALRRSGLHLTDVVRDGWSAVRAL